MKQILAVMTGGTIGSCCRHGVISVEGGRCRAIERYREVYGEDTVFTEVQPLNILSENLNKHHWEILVNFLLEQDLSAYDGILILHGSDTLSYTSAMLGLCLRHLAVPVVLTAADRIPDDPRSNAVCNIHAAVTVINRFSCGVFTVYRNSGEDFCSVYLPTLLQEADRVSGRFSSFDGTLFGKVTESGLTIGTEQLCPVREPCLLKEGRLHLANDVMMIRPYPSLLYAAIALPASVKAVLHITYHSGTTAEEALSLLKRCQAQGIDFYVTSVTGSALYETAALLLENGAVPIADLSNEAAYATLLLRYNP